MKTFVTKAQCTVLCLLGILVMVFAAYSTYAEDLRIMTYEGTTPPDRLDAFKQMVKTKYNVDVNISVKYISDPSEYPKALKNKEVDIINGPHNTLKDPRYKLIDGKLIIPIDLNNVPNYQDLIPTFQKMEAVTENNEVYGVPFGYAPYGLAYNTNVLKEPPASWTIFWEPQYAGQYAIGSDYEQNIHITLLAMGIERSQLGKFDVLSSPEFLEKLTSLVKNAKKMWVGADMADDLQGLAFATAWGFSFAELKNRGEMWAMAAPKEGRLAAIGNWMLSNTLREQPQLKHIAEEWINYVVSPDYQLNHVVRTLSTNPTNLAIKAQMTPEEVQAFHLDDPQYFQEQLLPYPVLDRRTRDGYELIWKKATR